MILKKDSGIRLPNSPFKYLHMNKTAYTGTVSFVNHEKKLITIDYELNGKKKSITAPSSLNEAGSSRKAHHYQVGDTVSFIPNLAPRGDKQLATDIRFLYNTAMEVLINKAQTENRFTGYLKQAGDDFFVKEIDSYLFFPVTLSPWQLKPDERELNEAVSFSLENLDRPERLSAKLFNNNYIPEFYTAVKLHKTKTPVEAKVSRIGAHGIYLDVIGNKIKAKMPLLDKKGKPYLENGKPGDKINVLISYLSTSKIVVEPVS